MDVFIAGWAWATWFWSKTQHFGLRCWIILSGAGAWPKKSVQPCITAAAHSILGLRGTKNCPNTMWRLQRHTARWLNDGWSSPRCYWVFLRANKCVFFFFVFFVLYFFISLFLILATPEKKGDDPFRNRCKKRKRTSSTREKKREMLLTIHQRTQVRFLVFFTKIHPAATAT